MLSFLLPVELHEGDVQMPLEELWQGAEHGSRHPEAHPGRPPRVRQPLFPLELAEASQHSPHRQAPGLRHSDTAPPVPQALPGSYSRGDPADSQPPRHQVTRPQSLLNL